MEKINTIFIANIAELAKPLTRLMNLKEKEEEVFEDHAYADRFIFSENDNRLLITPLPLDKNFITDTCRLLRFKNFLNFYPEKVTESTCKSILTDKKLLKSVSELIKKNPQIKIYAYASTPEFIKLVNFLKKQDLKFQTPELPRQNSLWTTAFFDSKAGFRQTIASFNNHFPPMPSGVICNNREEVWGWAKYYFENNLGLVIKTNRGLGGAGLHILRKEKLQERNLFPLISKIFKKAPYWQEEPIIIEEFISPNLKIGGGAPDIEVKVTDKGVFPLYVCGMRVSREGIFEGIEIGKQVLPEKLTWNLINCGRKFGRLLFQFGYRGFFDIDFVYSQQGILYPLEANLRRTGGTHAFELGQRILGKGFLQKYYLVSVLKIAVPRLKNKSYLEVKNFIKEFSYPIKGKKEGVILTVINYLKKGKLGYVVVGPNRKRVYEIEKGFLERLNS